MTTEIEQRIDSLKQEVEDLVGVGYPIILEIVEEIEALEHELVVMRGEG